MVNKSYLCLSINCYIYFSLRAKFGSQRERCLLALWTWANYLSHLMLYIYKISTYTNSFKYNIYIQLLCVYSAVINAALNIERLNISACKRRISLMRIPKYMWANYFWSILIYMTVRLQLRRRISVSIRDIKPIKYFASNILCAL